MGLVTRLQSVGLGNGRAAEPPKKTPRNTLHFQQRAQERQELSGAEAQLQHLENTWRSSPSTPHVPATAEAPCRTSLYWEVSQGRWQSPADV